MNATERPPGRADYGLDAPQVVRNLALAGVGCLALSLLGGPWRGFVFSAAAFFVTAGLMYASSRWGKRRLRDTVLDSLPWRGDERVLDVGCGRGLLLLGAAQRLTTGRAVGVDLWQSQDQSGNSPETTRENARREGVADRVDVQTGDARDLPFPDGSFDAVVSSLALHNIYDAAGRDQAVREIARVLRPGGRVALLDIRHTSQYAAALCACGLTDVRRAGPLLCVFPPSLLVVAQKPAEGG